MLIEKLTHNYGTAANPTNSSFTSAWIS